MRAALLSCRDCALDDSRCGRQVATHEQFVDRDDNDLGRLLSEFCDRRISRMIPRQGTGERYSVARTISCREKGNNYRTNARNMDFLIGHKVEAVGLTLQVVLEANC